MMRPRSRCASRSRELAALKESEELADFTLREDTTRLPPATSPVLSARRRLSTAGGVEHRSMRNTPPVRRARGADSLTHALLVTPTPTTSNNTKSKVNGYTFKEIPSPKRPGKLLKRHAVSLDARAGGGGDGNRRYVLRPRDVDKIACCGVFSETSSKTECCRNSANSERVATRRASLRRLRLISASSDKGKSENKPRKPTEPYVSIKKNTEIAHGRCNLCGSNPNKKQIGGWTREVVREFVTGICGAELAGNLYNEEIDGTCLLMISDIGWKFFKLLPRAKLGPFLYLLDYLQKLR